MLRYLILMAALSQGAVLAEAADAGTGAPLYILELPVSIQNVLIAETDTSTLYRFERNANTVTARERRYMSIGQNGVGKQRAWDRRTPLGIYFVNDRLDTSRMDTKYGPIAFPLDYPNAWDQLLERAGDGIWIHGVASDASRRPPRDTDGCIALPNTDLLELESHLKLLTTPVIITRSIRRASHDVIAKNRDELHTGLRAWVESYRDGDWHRYLSLYAADFTYRGLDREEWSVYRIRSSATRPIAAFSIDDVLLLADPEEEGLFLTRFRQTIVDDNGSIATIKRLYWRRTHDGELRIIAEDNG